MMFPLRMLGFAGGPKVVPVFKFLFMSDRARLSAHLARLAELPWLARLVPFHGSIVDAEPAAALHMTLLFLAACTSNASTSASSVLEETFTSADGLTAKVAIVVPESPSDDAPLGVLLFFTEDFGNSGYLEQASLHADIVAEHNLVLASMASPNAPGDAGCWWAPQVQDNAAYVEEFVQERLVGELGIDTERVFATGLSGGSDFAAAYHLHTDYRYGGGVVALCGGDIPRLNGGACEPEKDPDPAPAPTELSSADLDRVRYDFEIVADDPLFAHSEAAAAYYTGLGFSHFRHRIVDGSGHCGFESGWEGLDVRLPA